jgi:hypothetical protein
MNQIQKRGIMKKDNLIRLKNSDLILDSININLLKHFEMYKSKGHNLFCSYMSVGNKYKNELLVVGREPSYWWENFSIEELAARGPEFIFNTKIRYFANNELDFSHPLNLFTDPGGNIKQRGKYKTSYNPGNDPFWGCVKEIVLKLGICENDTNWASGIALTYLFKIAYCSKSYSSEKLRITQFEYCKEMFQLELLTLKPKRVLFLTGMKYVQNFLDLKDCSDREDCVYNLGEFDYGFHKAHTVVSGNPRMYKRAELVKSILNGF